MEGFCRAGFSLREASASLQLWGRAFHQPRDFDCYWCPGIWYLGLVKRSEAEASRRLKPAPRGLDG